MVIIFLGWLHQTAIPIISGFSEAFICLFHRFHTDCSLIMSISFVVIGIILTGSLSSTFIQMTSSIATGNRTYSSFFSFWPLLMISAKNLETSQAVLTLKLLVYLSRSCPSSGQKRRPQERRPLS